MTLQYSETIFEHFRHPRNYGALPAPEVAYEAVNALCGDRIRMELNVSTDQMITAVRFRGGRCIINPAAASILTELIPGSTPQEGSTLPPEMLLTALHTTIPPARVESSPFPLP